MGHDRRQAFRPDRMIAGPTQLPLVDEVCRPLLIIREISAADWNFGKDMGAQRPFSYTTELDGPNEWQKPPASE